ncbi:hypothetical protein [Niabella aquatica]
MPLHDDLPDALIKDNAAFLEISWLLPLIGLGCLLIRFPKTRTLGVLLVFPVMVGILLTHFFVAPGELPSQLYYGLYLFDYFRQSTKIFSIA